MTIKAMQKIKERTTCLLRRGFCFSLHLLLLHFHNQLCISSRGTFTLLTHTRATQELLVRPALDNSASLEHENIVGTLHRAESVCDDHHCASLPIRRKSSIGAVLSELVSIATSEKK